MSPLLIPAAVLFAITVLGAVLLRPFSYPVRTAFDTVCFLAISGFLFAHGVSPVFPPLPAAPTSDALWLRTVGGAWWLLGARLLVAVLWFTLHRNRRSREARLFSDLTAAAIYIAAAAVVVNSVFALPVTGLLATSGILAIVLALALQNTLADVFAGIAVGIEGPFGVGDRIQIGDRVEGLVVQVNWRSIRIQTDGNDVAIVPNSLVAKAEIVNRSIPSQRRAASVRLACPESAIPERVIEALLQATLLCPGILQMPAPGAALTQLGSRRNVYEIGFFVETTGQLSPTKDLLLRSARRQLHYAGFLDMNRETETAGSGLPRRLLGDLVLFECLSGQQLDQLAGHLQPRRLEPGEALFTEGEADASLYIVGSGVLKFIRQEGGIPKTIGCIGAGDYVGEIGLLTGAAHAATAMASTHCQVYHLSHDALAPLLEQNADLVAAIDKSARKGLDLLQRATVARATPDIGGPGQLSHLIRNFFRFGTAGPG